jgi:hypothetical protein
MAEDIDQFIGQVLAKALEIAASIEDAQDRAMALDVVADAQANCGNRAPRWRAKLTVINPTPSI